MDNFYRENILDHFKNPRNFGVLKDPDFASEENNPLCGDKITMQVKLVKSTVEPRVIEEIRFNGEGCAISMASASLLTDYVRNKTLTQVRALGTADILKLLGIELTPTRLKCALLSLEVLHKALFVSS